MNRFLASSILAVVVIGSAVAEEVSIGTPASVARMTAVGAASVDYRLASSSGSLWVAGDLRLPEAAEGDWSLSAHVRSSLTGQSEAGRVFVRSRRGSIPFDIELGRWVDDPLDRFDVRLELEPAVIPDANLFPVAGEEPHCFGSVGGNIAIVQFTRDPYHRFVEGVSIFAAADRVEGVTGQFRVYIINEDRYVLASATFPCEVVPSGEPARVNLELPSVEVPELFGIGVAWPGDRPPARFGIGKGGGERRSFLRESSTVRTSFRPGRNWMIRPDLVLDPAPGRHVYRLRDWVRPLHREEYPIERKRQPYVMYYL